MVLLLKIHAFSSPKEVIINISTVGLYLQFTEPVI